MICSEENFEELQELLINSDDEFDEVVWPNIMILMYHLLRL